LLVLADGVTAWWQHRVVDGAEATWSASVAEDLELVDYDAERLLLATGDYAETYRAVVLDRRTASTAGRSWRSPAVRPRGTGRRR
jgi:hypothetical protein